MESDQGKLFVGGISRETTEATLKDHFSKYGNVVSSVVAKDRNTKSPRGFGFVLFSEPSSADKALQDTHVILGRTVEVKKAIPRSEQHQNQQQQQQPHHNPNQQLNSGFSRNGCEAADSNNHFRTKKIFVGGLSASLTEDEFKNYFERFGRITDVVVMHDSSTNRPRGFGFVTFESEESVENVMQKNFHELNNRLVEVKRAVPKEGNNGSNGNYNMKTGVGRGSPYNGFQPAEYSSSSPGYGIFPGYGPLLGYNTVGGYVYGTGVYGSGYPTVGYERVGYGVSPVTPRGPLYAPVMLGARVFPLPYGTASIYPSYMNGGVGLMGTATGGFNGIIGTGVDGKWNQVRGGFGDLPANAMPPQIEGVNFGSDRPGLKEQSGGASSEQEQKGLDGQLKPLDASR
ncbi:RNA-binding protein 1-like [Durio zibethinus]|uniref:RNA-binding protein 1-like n=1 Tax=Durio zibethinus TaxID=66656 RepID=A0A6P5WYF6_DURZI|nr:RNA-binding protein 1-like [Durio zibethinus]XP_022721275.1 RNA-binding protein 1-like [Durio zibethinus]XP_022721357.1 RNA-binding protein 1-like [Durio zibethinus]XP_022721432.1 RNA-binding protein 1-like [Durio zibethinus]XP_022721511.1 RNA-binding protein 1-like [Durio zibethinus]XP_022721590.1 RNA-binding protein 1-like [Durio zibethinus]